MDAVNLNSEIDINILLKLTEVKEINKRWLIAGEAPIINKVYEITDNDIQQVSEDLLLYKRLNKTLGDEIKIKDEIIKRLERDNFELMKVK